VQGGGLHGSRQSLNRDVGPGVRGSNPAVNRSQDSSTGGGVAPPRTRGRDAAVARGSNPSLNRSVSAPPRPPLDSSSVVTGVVKGKVFPYSLPSAGPGADPGVQAVSPQVT